MKKLSVSEARKSLLKRIKEKSFFDKKTGCIIWTGSTLKSSDKFKRLPYGIIRLYGKNIFAHRASYSLFNSIIPDGLFVLHKCDNPKCINPKHLFLGTKRDNILDAIKKGRAPKRSFKNHTLNHGNVCKRAKVDEDKVRSIRKMYEMGFNQTIIAKFYRISGPTVSAIITKRAWFYVSD
jgi:hypothetical protein